MRIQQDQLIDELLSLTNQAIETVNGFKMLPYTALNHKTHPDSWSVLECTEHLNLYGDFYLPEIEKQLLNSKLGKAPAEFKGGFWGNYFVKVIKPNSGKKMKATKPMDPTRSELSPITLDRFLKQLERLKTLLEQSRKVDLTKVKTAISLTTLIKLRLGDTLCFLVYHNQRHILQAQRVLEEVPGDPLAVQ